MANDIIDINVYETTETVEITVNPNLTTININEVTGVGGSQNLQSVTNFGNTTTTSITANSFIKSGGTGANVLLDNGTTTVLANLGTKNDINSKQLQLNYLDRDNSIFDAFYLRTIADGGTVEASNQLLSSLAVLRNISYVNQGYTQQINADKFVKLGGTSAQYLMADGSISIGGGGGGSATLQNSIASGTDIYTATIAGVTSYVDGAGYLIRFTNGNTQTCSININGLGARTLYRNNDGQLIGGDIQDEGEMLLVYSSALSAFKCIGTSPNDIISYVTNAESITITKGQPVYAFGGVGDRMTVKLAYNTLDVTSAQTVGLVMSTSIAAGQKGYIIMQGLLDNLSTLSSPFVDGDTVYLGATAGTITRVKPSAPNHLVYLGIVTTSSLGAAGRMYVKPQNGYELNELHDVALTNPPTNNDGLFYELSTDLWKNKSIATALGYTPYNATNPSGYQTSSQVQTIADAKVANTITNGVTTSAPNQDVVFDALALKANDANVVHLTGSETIAGTKTFSSNIVIPGTGTQLILSVSSGGTVSGLLTTTYPDLTELTYLKGVTSSIQTQFSGKQPLNSNLTSLGNLTYPGAAPILRMYAPNLFSLDSNTYLTSVGISNLTATGTPSATTYLRGDNTWASFSAAPQNQYTILANNTASTAVPTEQVFRNEPSKAYTGTITVTAGTPPSGATNHTYSWCQVGDLVTIRLNLDYATAGATVTSLACMLPSDCPNPELPSGVATALNVISYGVGTMAANKASVATMGTAALRLKTTGPNTFDIQIQRASGSYATAYATIQYFV